MKGRMYSGAMAFTAQSAIFDAFELIAPTTGLVALVSIQLGQTTLLTDANEFISTITFHRFTGAYTSGSGGETPAMAALHQDGVATSATLEARNTTVAQAGSGAIEIIGVDAWNLRGGYLYLPPEDLRIVVAPTDAIIVTVSDPGTSVAIGGTIVWEEIGT